MWPRCACAFVGACEDAVDLACGPDVISGGIRATWGGLTDREGEGIEGRSARPPAASSACTAASRAAVQCGSHPGGHTTAAASRAAAVRDDDETARTARFDLDHLNLCSCSVRPELTVGFDQRPVCSCPVRPELTPGDECLTSGEQRRPALRPL